MDKVKHKNLNRWKSNKSTKGT